MDDINMTVETQGKPTEEHSLAYDILVQLKKTNQRQFIFILVLIGIITLQFISNLI